MITRAFLDGDVETVAFLRGELARHQVFLKELPYRRVVSPGDEAAPSPIVLLKADPKDPDQIGNLDYETAALRTLPAAPGADEFGEANHRRTIGIALAIDRAA